MQTDDCSTEVDLSARVIRYTGAGCGRIVLREATTHRRGQLFAPNLLSGAQFRWRRAIHPMRRMLATLNARPATKAGP